MTIQRFRFTYERPLTAIPSAQAIFGAICHGLKDVHGTDVLSSFFDDILSGGASFAVSSMYLADTLPFPLDIEPPRLDRDDLTKETLTTIKRLKKVRYLSTSLFDAYKKDPLRFNEELLGHWLSGEYVLSEKHHVLHDASESGRFDAITMKQHVQTRNKTGLTDDDKELFFTASLLYTQNTAFDFLVRADGTWSDRIHQVFETLGILSFGGLRSIGYNTMRYHGRTPFPSYGTDVKVLVSKALVIEGEVDPGTGFYRIGVIESKHDNVVKHTRYRQPLVVFEEGSVFTTGKDVIGTLVASDDGIPDYQNALGLLL
jgi:CRISPR type III-A-associated RAMP protein Csm4